MNDNFRSNKPGRRVPIDGISTRRSPRFNQGNSTDSFGGRPTQSGTRTPSHSDTLNSFNRSDGFHPTKQQQIRRPQSASDNVLIEPYVPKKRRRLFGGKHDNSGSRGKKKPVSKKKKILRIFLILLVILAIVGGILFAKGYITLKKVLSGGGGAAALQQNVDPSKLKGEGDGRVNILLLGRGGEGHEGADLTDTIILASVDPVAKDASLVSIPRDLYVKAAGNNGSMKINAVFSTGKTAAIRNVRQSDRDQKAAEEAGFKLLEETMESTLGIPIHYHVMIDFSGFKQAVDTVGGVSINAPTAVTETMRIDGRMYRLDVKPGQQQMDGFKALAYARSRYTSPRGDFDRSERQRIIINALKDKMLSAGTFGNPQKIAQLLDNFGNHVQTNFSVQDLQRLYEISKEVPSNKIGSIGLADPPNNFLTTSNIGGASVVIPTAGVGNFKDIQSFLRNSLKDSYIKNENASVMVLNGTTKAGLATEKGDELKSYGYTVTQVGNAPSKTYQSTVIVDMRSGNKKYTKSYLEKRFKVTSVTSLPDPAISAGDADFVIILGSDQVVSSTN